MLADAVQTLYEYNRWATDRVMTTAVKLTPPQLLAPGTAGQGSIRDTLVHLLSAQRGWLSWWDGTAPTGGRPGLKAEDFTDVSSIRDEWGKIEDQTRTFVSKLEDSTLGLVYSRTRPDGTSQTFPLWQMMLHVANHGTQHRSEVAAMLTGAGHSPGNLDLSVYLRESGGRPGS